ncbi:hypothetical protein ElyMa_004052300 [Elysia marginata]|uniref:Uncharacterized protein n=1 Tax=Elysia marginata TaxID=1093978 RepID=A0AAV4G5M4_9GAST|nr:hypothetical protein ElyMa_004052300 [Elysia marginata]
MQIQKFEAERMLVRWFEILTSESTSRLYQRRRWGQVKACCHTVKLSQISRLLNLSECSAGGGGDEDDDDEDDDDDDDDDDHDHDDD